MTNPKATAMQSALRCVPPPTISFCTGWGPQSPSSKLGCSYNLLPCQMHSSSIINLLQEMSRIPQKSVNKQSTVGVCYHPVHPATKDCTEVGIKSKVALPRCQVSSECICTVPSAGLQHRPGTSLLPVLPHAFGLGVFSPCQRWANSTTVYN